MICNLQLTLIFDDDDDDHDDDDDDDDDDDHDDVVTHGEQKLAKVSWHMLG